MVARHRDNPTHTKPHTHTISMASIAPSSPFPSFKAPKGKSQPHQAPMPGTIHVFVLDLMDLPFDGSPLILKLAMGKRECQIVGKGECSFPVMSLRENLVLMLHDKEGNELSRTELATMSVVEKGIWDDLFPLEGGGGHIHMRVQFSLSEEERLRIREMREAVVRKKQIELLKGQETGSLGSYPTTKLLSDGTKIEKTEQTDAVKDSFSLRSDFNCVCGNPFGTLSLQEFGESSEQAFKQNDPHHTELSKKEIGIQHEKDVSSVETSNSSLSDELNECGKPSSEQMEPTKAEQLDTTYAGNITEDSSSIGMENDQILETRRKGFHRRSSSSNVKKMITAFETTLSQGLEPSFNPKLSEYSEPNNIKKVKIPRILTKSFSAGMLSDIKPRRHPAVDRSIVEKKVEKSQFYVDNGKNQELANEPIETERTFSIRGMVENSNDDFHLSDKASCDVQHRQEIKTDHHVLAEEDLAVRKMIGESVNNVRPCPCTQQDSSPITAMEVSGQINPRTSNEDVLLLSRYSDSRGCSSPSLVSCVPRHFCVTIGSKQLRDLIECCDLSVGTHLMENYHFINEVHGKESAQGDGLLEVDEDEEISPASENSNIGHSQGMGKSSGMLIEQVVRTVLIIIAGGTLVLNARLRRPR